MKQHKYLHISLRCKLSGNLWGKARLELSAILWAKLCGAIWDMAGYNLISAARKLI